MLNYFQADLGFRVISQPIFICDITRLSLEIKNYFKLLKFENNIVMKFVIKPVTTGPITTLYKYRKYPITINIIYLVKYIVQCELEHPNTSKHLV